MKRSIVHYFVEGFGWYGVVAIVGAYATSTWGFIQPSSSIYQWLNLTGAIGVVCVSFYKGNVQPGVLNLIWAVVALVALVRSI